MQRLTRRTALAGLVACLAVATACGGSPPGPGEPSTPGPRLPDNVPVANATAARSPYVAPASEALSEARGVLFDVVSRWGLDGANAWALGHALVALGPEARLPDGQLAVDHLFSAYAERFTVGEAVGLRFPTRKDGVAVEPHEALVLKEVTDLGLSPERVVTAQGQPTPLSALYRGTLYDLWVDGERLSVSSWNDTPWALHGLAAWSPPGTAWTAVDGHPMSLDAFTHAVVDQLVAETAFLAAARAAGTPFAKQRQGIFAYTCGGAHLLQGAGMAVARGFGAPEDRARVIDQARLQIWRFPRELAIVDQARAQAPEYELILVVQRLKFVGHHLETLHRFGALGLLDAADPAVEESLAAGTQALIETVAALKATGALDQMPQVRQQREQTWLDIVGDGAHALHAIDLGTGDAVVWR